MIQDPTPDDVVALRTAHGLRQTDFGALVHASERAVQNWEAPKGTASHRPIPKAQWELANLKLGEIPLDRSMTRKNRARRKLLDKKAGAAEASAPATPAPDATAKRLQELRDRAAQAASNG